MPFKSQAQRAYMHIHHPRIADRWEEHTPKGKKLPEHVPGSEATEKKSAFYGHGVAQAMLDVGLVKHAWPWSGGQGTLGPQAQASQRGAYLARPQGGSVPLDPSKGLGAAASQPAVPKADPLQGMVGQNRNRAAMDAGTWK